MAVRAQQRFAQLQPITGPAFIGKVTGGSGASIVMSVAQAASILPTVTASLNGLVPAPGAPTGRFFRDDFTWVTVSGGGGSGTVTSVSGSGGTTGLSLSGGPITVSGTLTISGILNVANGGLGRTSVSTGSIPFGSAVATDALSISANLSFTTGTNTLNVPNIKSATTTLELASNNGSTAVSLTDAGNFISTSTLINFTTGASSILSTTGAAGIHSAVISFGNLAGNFMEYTAASQRLRFYRSGTTLTTHNIAVTSGDVTTTSGDHIAITGGTAYSVSGNGNGGNITITPGQRRVAGSGIDGNIILANSVGNVFINTTTGAAKLQIKGGGTGGSATFLTTDSAGTQRFEVVDNGNVGIGQTSYGSGLGVLAIGNAALAPSGSSTDGVSLYAADVSSASVLHIKTEAGPVIRLYQVGTYTVTNGTTDRTFDADATTLDELADIVATIIADIKNTRIFA